MSTSASINSSTGQYVLGCDLRKDEKPPFPLGWLTFSIILIVILIIVLFYCLTIKEDLVDPSQVPVIKGRYAVIPNVDKEALNACGSAGTVSGGNQPCVTTVTSLSQAIQYCEVNYKICSEFSYNPISGVVKITDPGGETSSSQQGNVYLQQIGFIQTE